MKNPKLSIIVPFYNHGDLLLEALESVSSISRALVEVIVINDGSTDPNSLAVLEKIRNEPIRIVHQKNQGLASARNNGIRASVGEYILPLDSDNKIRIEYVYKGIEILEKDPTIGVVYGNPIFFGAIDRRKWTPGPFNANAIRLSNYIDACAIFRRQLWEQLGEYDGNMPWMGHEDWEFWVRISGTRHRFHHINEGMFYYRVSDNSMISRVNSQKFIENFSYIIKKHPNLYSFLPEKYFHTFSKISRMSGFRLKILKAFVALLNRS